jgi:hypothetical protein
MLNSLLKSNVYGFSRATFKKSAVPRKENGMLTMLEGYPKGRLGLKKFRNKGKQTGQLAF